MVQRGWKVAFGLAVAIAAGIAFGPIYGVSRSALARDGTMTGGGFASGLSVNGAAIAVVLIPVVLAGLPMLFAAGRQRHRAGVVASVVMFLFALAPVSIGLLFLPVAIVLAIASDKEKVEPLSKSTA